MNITGDTFVDAHSLFRGAVIFDGEGILDVRKVGLKTMMGKMAEEMQEDEPDSPLKVKLAKLAKQISTFRLYRCGIDRRTLPGLLCYAGGRSFPVLCNGD